MGQQQAPGRQGVRPGPAAQPCPEQRLEKGRCVWSAQPPAAAANRKFFSQGQKPAPGQESKRSTGTGRLVSAAPGSFERDSCAASGSRGPGCGFVVQRRDELFPGGERKPGSAASHWASLLSLGSLRGGCPGSPQGALDPQGRQHSFDAPRCLGWGASLKIPLWSSMTLSVQTRMEDSSESWSQTVPSCGRWGILMILDHADT